MSRLAYRKGIDLLVATAPRICALFPNVNFVVGLSCSMRNHSPVLITTGGDGPKLIDLLQMREKYLLQDRIELLGPIRHKDVLSVRFGFIYFLFVFSPLFKTYTVFF